MLCHPLFVKWLRKEGTNPGFYGSVVVESRIFTIYVSNFSPHSMAPVSLRGGEVRSVLLGPGARAWHQLGRGRGSSLPGKYSNFELHHAAGGGGAGGGGGAVLYANIAGTR